MYIGTAPGTCCCGAETGPAGGGANHGTAPAIPDTAGTVGCEVTAPGARITPRLVTAGGAIVIGTLTGGGVCAAYPYTYPGPMGLAAHTGLPAIGITLGNPDKPQGITPAVGLLVFPVGAVVVVTVTTGTTPPDTMLAGIGVVTMLTTLAPAVETPVDLSAPGAAVLAAATGVSPVAGWISTPCISAAPPSPVCTVIRGPLLPPGGLVTVPADSASADTLCL